MADSNGDRAAIALKWIFKDDGGGVAYEPLLPYLDWEQAFIRRWGFVPEDGHVKFESRAVYSYIVAQGQDPYAINPWWAARAFHTTDKHVSQNMMSNLLRMEKDYDLIPPSTIDEAMGLQESDEMEQGFQRAQRSRRPKRRYFLANEEKQRHGPSAPYERPEGTY